MILKRKKPVAFRNQTVEIDLFRPLMVPYLHAVKVKQFPSGKKHTLREREDLGQVDQGKLVGGHGTVAHRRTVEEYGDIIHLFQH